LEIINNKVELVTSGDIDSYCIKTTKTNPNLNSICWTKVKSEKTVVSLLALKKHYIWIKDTSGNISSPRVIER